MVIYFDNAATNPVDERVKECMDVYLTNKYHNASSLYTNGREAKEAIEKSREQAAKLLHCNEDEVIFTSGGTEADNLALKGIAWSYLDKGRHIITTSIEHHAILDSAEWLKKQGFSITYLPVDSQGRVDLSVLKKEIRKDTILISAMWVNNELGTIQPIREIAEIAKNNGILFHTDAVQAAGTEKINVKEMGIDLLSISSHKIYGPKGAGILYCRRGIELTPLLHGGQQERHLRGGTECVANIVGFGKAIELTIAERDERVSHLKELRSYFLGFLSEIKDICINGSLEHGVPNIINIGIKDVDAEAVLILLNQKGIQISMGSACTSESIEPSHVLLACNVPQDYIRGSIRVSLSKYNTLDEITEFIKIMKETLITLRNY